MNSFFQDRIKYGGAGHESYYSDLFFGGDPRGKKVEYYEGAYKKSSWKASFLREKWVENKE